MPVPERIAFLIANQTFPPDSGLPSLRGPANDLKALARLLRDPTRGRFEVKEFFDKAHHEVLPDIERSLTRAGPDDLLLIYYSGHGKQDFPGRLYLATADTSREALATTSIPFYFLSDLVDHSVCQQAVLLVDCCYSGAVGVRGDVESELQLAAGCSACRDCGAVLNQVFGRDYKRSASQRSTYRPVSVSVGRLMEFLTILGQDVEVTVKPSSTRAAGDSLDEARQDLL